MPNVVPLLREDAPPGEFANQGDTFTLPLRFRTRILQDHQTTPDQQHPGRPEVPFSPSRDQRAAGLQKYSMQDFDVNTLNMTISLEFKNLTVAHFDASGDPSASDSPDIGDVLFDTISGSRRQRKNNHDRRFKRPGSGTKPKENPTPAEDRRTEEPRTITTSTSGEVHTAAPAPRDNGSLGQQWASHPRGTMSFHVLLDRFNMSKLIFPAQWSEAPYDFWSSVDTIYVNVSRELVWDDFTSIESGLVLRQLFRKNKSILIPLRDVDRVGHAWEVLSVSNEPQVERLRDELEQAASAVLGPEVISDLPFDYQAPTTYRWETVKERFMWHWLYMRYLGQPWCIPFEEIWDRFEVNGKRVSVPKYPWVLEELRKMPKIEEVLFIALPGFVPPPGACRLTPPMMVLDDRNRHISFSEPPRLIEASEWDTYLEVPPGAMANGNINYSQYTMVTQVM
ncbi:hypothetical protein LIA77_08303 [Sarocladium implicatum]|nr:hypothetical protein LIA77_08303 [Sarocladium implicatum]